MASSIASVASCACPAADFRFGRARLGIALQQDMGQISPFDALANQRQLGLTLDRHAIFHKRPSQS